MQRSDTRVQPYYGHLSYRTGIPPTRSRSVGDYSPTGIIACSACTALVDAQSIDDLLAMAVGPHVYAC